MLQMPRRHLRRPCGQDLCPGSGSARMVCLLWKGADQGPAVFRGILPPPPTAPAFLCTERSCVMLEFFSQQTKEPSCGAWCDRGSCGLVHAVRNGGSHSAVKVGSVSDTVPARLGWWGGVTPAHGVSGARHRRAPRG